MSHSVFFRWVWMMLAPALLAGCGGGGSSAPIVDLNGAPAAEWSDLTFEVTVEPRGDDPREVEVRVTASRPDVWARLPTDPDDLRWEKLVILRRMETSDQSSEPASEGAVPGIPGRCEIAAGGLRFRPRFPLLAGEGYRAEFHRSVIPGFDGPGAPLSLPVVTWHLVPAVKPDTVPRVTAIYPTASVLPANHLKFYIVFSEPMRQGNIWGHFELKNETDGETVPEPFRLTELWSEDNMRLTLWFHPGRQKEGVNLNVEIGPVLEEGKKYTLAISKDWLSQKGAALGETVKKSFRAGPKDRAQPDPTTWKITVPAADSRDALRLDFPEPLDWALIHSRIAVENKSGKAIEGHIETADDERSWRFIPSVAWRAGEYRLAVGSVLEDLAGNSIARPFEVDLEKEPESPASATVQIPFRVSLP